jgi:hypothetical protein
MLLPQLVDQSHARSSCMRRARPFRPQTRKNCAQGLNMRRPRTSQEQMTRLAPICLALCACATVPAGQGGVVWNSAGVQPEPLSEGLHFVGPVARVQLYDLRAQERSETLQGLSADGAAVEASASVVTFHVDAGDLPALERQLGPAYYQQAVAPLVRAGARRILSRFRVSELDSAGVRRAQAELEALLIPALQKLHVVLDGVAFKRVLPLSQPAYQAVLDTGAAEQDALTAATRVQLARQRAEALREEAHGLASGNDIVAPTLSKASLDDSRQRAWESLLQAPGTRVLVTDQKLLMEVPP